MKDGLIVVTTLLTFMVSMAIFGIVTQYIFHLINKYGLPLLSRALKTDGAVMVVVLIFGSWIYFNWLYPLIARMFS